MIIDGLDECRKSEKKPISTFVRATIDSVSVDDPTKLRCLFVSQNDNDIFKLLNGVPTLQINSKCNGQDIVEYCAVRADGIGKKFGIDASEVENMVVTVSSRADGEYYKTSQ